MKFVVVSVRDRLTGFKSVGLEANVDVAKRNFKLALHREKLLIEKSDLELHQVGTFDTLSGVVVPTVPSVLLMAGSEVE